MAAPARTVPRGQHDRGAARPSLGQPPRTMGLPRRPARGRPDRDGPADRSERSPDSRQPARRALRGRARLHEPARRAARSPGSTTDRGPTSSTAFPFPHVVTVEARLDERELRLTTEIEPTGRAAVPISFCWHPYLRLPDAPRRAWKLRWPACSTCSSTSACSRPASSSGNAAERAALGSRTFDDHYALGTDRRFSLSAGRRKVELRFGPTYPFAQLFVPARGDFAAIEPMTATIDALGHGSAPSVAPGETFRAWFTIGARDAPPPARRRAHRLSRQPVRTRRPLLDRAHTGRARGHVVSRPGRLAAARFRRDRSRRVSHARRRALRPGAVHAHRDPVAGSGERRPADRTRAGNAIWSSSAAADVVAHLERGTGVAVHCMGGRGRTGTVIGVALVRPRPRSRCRDRVLAPARRRARAPRLAREPVAGRGRRGLRASGRQHHVDGRRCRGRNRRTGRCRTSRPSRRSRAGSSRRPTAAHACAPSGRTGCCRARACPACCP